MATPQRMDMADDEEEHPISLVFGEYPIGCNLFLDLLVFFFFFFFFFNVLLFFFFFFST